MRIFITLSVAFILIKAKAQELRSIQIKTNSVVVEYDSTGTVTGMQYDTVRTKTVVKFPGKQTSKVDFAYAQTPVSATDTTTVNKTFSNPVDMRFQMTSATMMNVTINGQQFKASKYGFGGYADTASTAPVVRAVYKDSIVNVPIPIYVPQNSDSLKIEYIIKHQ